METYLFKRTAISRPKMIYKEPDYCMISVVSPTRVIKFDYEEMREVERVISDGNMIYKTGMYSNYSIWATGSAYCVYRGRERIAEGIKCVHSALKVLQEDIKNESRTI